MIYLLDGVDPILFPTQHNFLHFSNIINLDELNRGFETILNNDMTLTAEINENEVIKLLQPADKISENNT